MKLVVSIFHRPRFSSRVYNISTYYSPIFFSGELDLNNADSLSPKRRSGGKLGADGWSPHLVFANKKLEESSPILASDLHLRSDECEAKGGDEARVLGSPFHTPGGRHEKLPTGSSGEWLLSNGFR